MISKLYLSKVYLLKDNICIIILGKILLFYLWTNDQTIFEIFYHKNSQVLLFVCSLNFSLSTAFVEFSNLRKLCMGPSLVLGYLIFGDGFRLFFALFYVSFEYNSLGLLLVYQMYMFQLDNFLNRDPL